MRYEEGAMRTLIVGAGAIGSYLAARLSEAGGDVTLHGKGAGFAVIAAKQQIRLGPVDATAAARAIAVRCSVAVPEPGEWDLLVLAVKAQDLGTAARQFAQHARSATTLLPQNGLPWWHFLGTAAAPRRLASVDPGGLAEAALPLGRIAGCVVTKGLGFDRAGVLREASLASDLFTLGDVVPGSGVSAAPASWIEQAGLPVKHTDDIRTEKWRKLLINVAFNPLGAISHLGFGEILDEPQGEGLARSLMAEALAVARSTGLAAEIDVEAAFHRARGSRLHKTSMLQDVEAGRRLELEPILGVMLELAGQQAVPVPAISAVYACARLIDMGLVKGPIRRITEPA
jgi:2-dehydropantoate 2-reductase